MHEDTNHRAAASLATAAPTSDEDAADTTGFWATPALGLAAGLAAYVPPATEQPPAAPPGQWNNSAPE